MGNCEKCGTNIDDKYKFCLKCVTEMKETNNSIDNLEIIKALSAINNNLYYLRRAAAIMLAKQAKVEISWDKEKKDFVEKKIK